MELIKEICRDVGNTLGKGFAEVVYQEAICTCLREHRVHYAKEVVLPVNFKNTFVGNVRADIILNDFIIECKAIDSVLKPSHLPQLVAYMELTKLPTGLLVNFNQNPSKNVVECVEIVYDEPRYIATFENGNVYILDHMSVLIQKTEK